ncbi:MAG: S-layer homology domain-containing protein, partial [Bacillota bacterium]
EIILANSDIKDGVYKAPLHQAASQADANTYLRLRAYYSYRSHLGAELFRSAYSNIVEFGAPGWGKASSWAQSDIEKAGGLGLIPVSLKGVDLTRPITREEFTELTLILYEKTTGVKTTPFSPNPFVDTNNPEILKAYNVGIAKGMSATTYAPKALITREQVATILLRALKLIAPNGDYSTTGAPTFLDQKDISDWALSSVQVISKLGIIKGANGKFMPRAVTTAQQAAGYGNTTREQAILLSLRTYEAAPSLKAAAPTAPSLPSGSTISSQTLGKGSFSGNWSVKDPVTGAEVCTMAISQSGSTVTGTFTDMNKNSGGMSGTVSGNVLTATIDNEFFEGWKFVLTMAAGNNSFTGVWASSTESHAVTGSRV